MIATVVLLWFTLVLVAPVFAQERTRVDLFAPDGTRQGSAVIDERTGHVDFFDAMSRPLGWGRVDSTGKVERFRLDGRRREETAVPLPLKPWVERITR